MNSKKTAVIIVVIIFISIIALLGIIFYIMKVEKTETGNNEVKIENKVEEGRNEEERPIEENETQGNEEEEEEGIGYDFDPEYGMDIFTEEELEGQKEGDIYTQGEGNKIEYSEEEISKFTFETKGIPEEIGEYVNSIEEIKDKIKKYIYSNSHITATEANYVEYRFHNQESTVTIYFELNDELTELVVSIDQEDKNNITIEDRLKVQE